MTLSIEVLPAPFGPMMARTSPFLISKDTSRMAFTPPKDSTTCSTASSTSPGAMVPDVSFGLSPPVLTLLTPMGGAGRRMDFHVDNRHVAVKHALAAILDC